jgi:ABC-2 type transport system permease protein
MSAAEPTIGPAIAGPSLASRLAGLGSVFGKTIRDGRRAIVAVGLIVGLISLVVGATVATQFPTEADRTQLATQMEALPALFRGLIGEPIAVDTMPGFISWRTLNFAPIFVGIWSAIAMSGLIAGEIGKGSLEVLVAWPLRRWSLAASKAAAHVIGMVVAMAIASLITVGATIALGTLPGDQASLAASAAEFTWIGLGALFAGAVAWLLGPILGRAQAAAAGTMLLVASYIVNGFAASVPFFQSIEFLSIFDWTAGHRPLAGVYDWGPVAAVALLDAVLITAGIVVFVQRDILAPSSHGPSPAGARWSIRGVVPRSLAESLATALPFGVGVGAFGFFVAVSADEFGKVLAQVPQLGELLERFFPGLDLSTAAGVLQLMFITFSALLYGLAAASLAHDWGADEREGRLETVLAAPISRVGWAIRSGAGTLLSVSIAALVTGTLIAIGTIIRGDDPSGPFIGTLVVGIYATGLAGVGLAVGGVFSPRLGGLVVGLYVIGAFLLEFVGAPLDLPDALLDLSLARHIGQPMIGTYDPVGMAFCVLLAIGGLIVCAVGFRRRDLAA